MNCIVWARIKLLFYQGTHKRFIDKRRSIPSLS